MSKVSGKQETEEAREILAGRSRTGNTTPAAANGNRNGRFAANEDISR